MADNNNENTPVMDANTETDFGLPTPGEYHLPENAEWAETPWPHDDPASPPADPPADDSFDCYICCMGPEDTEIHPLYCGEHAICTDCLRQAVSVAAKDESAYPIRCGDKDSWCTAISTEIIENILISTDSDEDRALLQRFLAKAEEWSVPAAERTYCANTTCHIVQGESRYLDPDILGDEDAVLAQIAVR
jgi:hypothetical protein